MLFRSPRIFDSKIEKNSMIAHHAHTLSDFAVNALMFYMHLTAGTQYSDKGHTAKENGLSATLPAQAETAEESTHKKI